MKKSTHNPQEAPEQQHYKKKYLQRVIETKDAENEIKTFKANQGQEDLPDTSDVETKRPM